MSKYSDMVFDGRWKVNETNRHTVILENIYNHETMSLTWSVFYKIVKGKTTVSNVRGIRAYRSEKGKSPRVVTRHFRRKRNEY